MDLNGLISITLRFADGTTKEFSLTGDNASQGGSPPPARGNIELALAEVLLADGLAEYVGVGATPDGEVFPAAVPDVVDPFIDLLWDTYGIAIPTGHRTDIPENPPDPGPIDFAEAIADGIAFAYQVNDLIGSLSEDERLNLFVASMEDQGYLLP